MSDLSNLNAVPDVYPIVDLSCDSDAPDWYLSELKIILSARLPYAIKRSFPQFCCPTDYKITAIKRVNENRSGSMGIYVRIDVLFPGEAKQNSYYFRVNENNKSHSDDNEVKEKMEALSKMVKLCKEANLTSIPVQILEKAADGDLDMAMDDLSFRVKKFHQISELIKKRKYELAKGIVREELFPRFGRCDAELHSIIELINSVKHIFEEVDAKKCKVEEIGQAYNETNQEIKEICEDEIDKLHEV